MLELLNSFIAITPRAGNKLSACLRQCAVFTYLSLNSGTKIMTIKRNGTFRSRAQALFESSLPLFYPERVY